MKREELIGLAQAGQLAEHPGVHAVGWAGPLPAVGDNETDEIIAAARAELAAKYFWRAARAAQLLCLLLALGCSEARLEPHQGPPTLRVSTSLEPAMQAAVSQAAADWQAA